MEAKPAGAEAEISHADSAAKPDAPDTCAAPRRLSQPALLLLLAVAEGLCILGLIALGATLVPVLALHAAALGAGGWLLFQAEQRGEDVTLFSLGLLGAVPLGPLGFAGGAALASMSATEVEASPLVQQWYDRIAHSAGVPADERLYEDVDVGRTLAFDAPPPASFPATMAFGSLQERQAILGQIARHFDLGFLETLKIALASPEPVVRVQAAAVAAHVGPRMRRLLGDRVEAASRLPVDPLEALALHRDLSALLRSGLLDASESRQAEALARRLGDTVIEAVARRPLSVEAAGDAARRATLGLWLEQVLIERGAFGLLRSQRTAARLRARHPRARFRRLAVPAPAAENAP